MIRKISQVLLNNILWNKLLPVYINKNTYLVTEGSVRIKAKKLYNTHVSIMKMINDMKEHKKLQKFIKYFENVRIIGEVPPEICNCILYSNDMFLIPFDDDDDDDDDDIVYVLSVFCKELTKLPFDYCNNLIMTMYQSKYVSQKTYTIHVDHFTLKDQRLTNLLLHGRNLDNRLNTAKFFKETEEFDNKKMIAYAKKNNLL